MLLVLIIEKYFSHETLFQESILSTLEPATSSSVVFNISLILEDWKLIDSFFFDYSSSVHSSTFHVAYLTGHEGKWDVYSFGVFLSLEKKSNNLRKIIQTFK